MVKKAFQLAIVTGLILGCMVVFGFNSLSRINWLNPADEVFETSASEKPVLVDVYTNWCYYCKVMDATTWKDDSLVNYVNEKFRTVKFDAESKKNVVWDGSSYQYNPRYKLNMLAIKLLQGQMSFPSTVIIPAKGDPIILPGAFKPQEAEMMLKYYGERANESMTLRAFQSGFRRRWK